VPMTGSVAPLPTMMEEGKVEEENMVTIPELAVMWEEAPESMTQSEEVGGEVRETVLTAVARECGSHGGRRLQRLGESRKWRWRLVEVWGMPAISACGGGGGPGREDWPRGPPRHKWMDPVHGL
jgi:hypothetical protein